MIGRLKNKTAVVTGAGIVAFANQLPYTVSRGAVRQRAWPLSSRRPALLPVLNWLSMAAG